MITKHSEKDVCFLTKKYSKMKKFDVCRYTLYDILTWTNIQDILKMKTFVSTENS